MGIGGDYVVYSTIKPRQPFRTNRQEKMNNPVRYGEKPLPWVEGLVLRKGISLIPADLFVFFI
jgi:hypothetical protein